MTNTIAKPITAVRTAVVVASRSRWGITIAGASLMLLGVVALLVELLRYWLTDHPIHAAPVCIGCLFGFVGAFIVSPKRAVEGAAVVVDSTVRVIGTMRGGRRSTDAPVVVASKSEEKP